MLDFNCTLLELKPGEGVGVVLGTMILIAPYWN